MSLKLLHTSDLHLGAKLGNFAGNADRQRRQLARAFEKIVQVAVNKNVDLVLVAGDIFDSLSPDKEYLTTVRQGLDKLIAKQIYCAVIPGNHDYLADNSPYKKSEFQLESEYFKLFTDPEIDSWLLADLDLVVYGAAITKQKSKRSQLDGFRRDDSAKHAVLLLHGSIDLQQTPDNYPLLQKDLKQADVDYIALGDWHSYLEVIPDKAYYCGSPEFLSYSQSGAGSVNLVEIEGKQTKVTRENISELNVVDLNLAIEDYQDGSALERAILEHKGKGVIAQITFTGIRRLELTWSLAKLQEKLAEEFFVLQCKDETRLEIDETTLKAYPETTIIGKYIREVESLREANEYDEQVLKDALQLGVHMLKGEENAT